MNTRTSISLAVNFIAGLISVSPAIAQKVATATTVRPNVLLILSDDHSVPYLGCYGNPDLKTPNIDRLAKEGIRFDNCFTTAPQCVPSRASIMTGRSVVDVGMLRFSAPLDRSIITYPELLKKEGYYIGVCGRPYHLDGAGKSPAESIEAFQENNMITFPDRFDFVKVGSDEQTITQFEEFLNQPHGDKPFFMQAGFHDPHRIFDAFDFEPDPEKITVPAGMPDTKLLRKDLAGHYGEIQRLDYHVGKLLDVLEKHGLLENTLILFMGDNGAALLRGKGTLYDCGLHVPLLARYPGLIKAGSVSEILISGEDIGPTVLDFAQVKPDEKMTGQSFLSAFSGSDREIREYAFAVRGTHGSGLPGNSAVFDLSRTVFNKKFRLIYNPMFNLPYYPVDFAGQKFWKELIGLNEKGELPKIFSQTYIFTSERPMFELYDLKNDPNEFFNLSGKSEYEKIEHDLKTALQKWMIINRDVVPLPIPPSSFPLPDEKR